MQHIEMSRVGVGTIGLSLEGQSAGSLRLYVIRPTNDGMYGFKPCESDLLECGNDAVNIKWRSMDKDVLAGVELKRQSAGFSGTFWASGTGHALIRLLWELPRGLHGFPFVPAFMYGWNLGGRHPGAMYPQLDNGTNSGRAKPWVCPEWSIRADRSSHAVTSVITDHFTCALGGRDVCRYDCGTVTEKNGLTISSDDSHRLSYSLGFINAPFTYSAVLGRNYISRPEGFIDLDVGRVSSPCFLFLYANDTRQGAAARLLRESHALIHDEVHGDGELVPAVTAIANAVVEHGYSQKARNFRTSFGDSRGHPFDQFFSSAWAGGLRTGYPLLMAGHQLGNKRWLKVAREVLSNVAENGISPTSGLFYENYDLARDEWSTRGWWRGHQDFPAHSGYVNGQVCHYLLLGYLAEKAAKVEQPEWLGSAERVLDHIARVQGEDGRFGYFYSESDGTILDGDGFSGCWFTPAFATLYQITGKNYYLEVARKAMDFYRRDVQAFHVYGGPHDISKSPDEEGILAWIDAARILHEATNDQGFLTDLLIGLDYEFSWKFAYNVVNEVEPLKSLNWCSTGGSVTSVNNSHIHPMGSAILNSILYAVEQTGDNYLRSRLMDTLRWTLTVYLHHDGHYGWGKKGMINERFCYTDSLLCERFPDGSPASTWFCGHSWASGAVLEGLTGTILDMATKGNLG